MSWAEFQIRIIGHNRKLKRDQEFEMLMAREIAYEVHKLGFMFDKKNPKNKEIWWPIGDKKTTAVTEDHLKAFKIAVEKSKAKKDG